MPYANASGIAPFLLLLLLARCETRVSVNDDKSSALPLTGTWELISGTTIQGKDTTVTDYTKDKRFIKVINQSHFAFTGHDLTKGKDSTAFFSSGAGTYTVTDSNYTEHLQFCSDRAWEGHDFSFTVQIRNDTLTQTGIEKVENMGINRLNIEKYVRVR